MPLPALIPAAITAAKWAAPVIGGMLASSAAVGVADALAGAKGPEEAAKMLAPRRQEAIDKLVGGGMPESAAAKQVDADMQSELEALSKQSNLPDWAGTAIGLAAGLGGGVGTYKLLGKIGSKAAAASATVSKPAVTKDVPITDRATAEKQLAEALKRKPAGGPANAEEDARAAMMGPFPGAGPARDPMAWADATLMESQVGPRGNPFAWADEKVAMDQARAEEEWLANKRAMAVAKRRGRPFPA